MVFLHGARARLFGAIFTALIVPAAGALAAASDYRLELVESPVKSGKTSLFKVRLVHLPDGQSVSGAVISQTRFDMGPEGMAEMTAPAKASATAELGVYQIEAEPSAPGKWALTLTAKIKGEPEAVGGSVTVAVAK